VAAGPLSWQLRRLPVCASTELELARWLEARERQGRPLPEGARALAVVARRQRFGVGQQGRIWHSPAGGLWLSAALPWPAAPEGTAPLALTAALGLALQLEQLGLHPQLKWPNDLLIGGRKLAGVLPRLRWRGGAIRWAQVGVGLNGNNRVPAGAINLAAALAGGRCGVRWHPRAQPRWLEPLVLAGLGWAAARALAADSIRRQAEARLWVPAEGWPHAGRLWLVRGLNSRGGLLLQRGPEQLTLERQPSV
jgi:BirA family transcriptional regulator, biotin operon repressor / biotin---[acetyl-CoA-carboxylase] ligase